MGARTTFLGCVAGLMLATSGAARAEPLKLSDITPLKIGTVRAPGEVAEVAGPPTDASIVAAAVLPKRSVERRLGSEGVVGSAGFLCGRDPALGDHGASAVFGDDPHGRFLGARLSFAFR